MSPAADRLVANRYALKDPLGRGGMGVVWRAQDSVLGREVAVKEVVFPPTMAEEERGPAQARVMREARAAARLNHPGAVTLYDVVKDRGSTFIVMELVSAPTLADLVRTDGPLPVQRVAEIGAQVASALEAAHQAGIVHRDVKPGNVMVPANGTAKLADFGIASLQGDPQLTSTGLVIGSPAYMAPEQAKGEESGPPADFWALGATMFYAVEGGPPFDRGSSIATLAAVVNEPPRDLRRAGPLTPLITALLSKDPGARPSGPELRAELARLATPAPSPPTEVLPTHGPGRTVPLAAFVPAPAGEGDGSGAVDSPEHPASGSATLPHRGTSQREGGFPAAQREGVPAAGAPVPELAPALEPEPPAAEPPAAEAAGREPGRPLLPPAPVVGRGGRGRLVAVL
ncbi:MAG TPA: serine/threonine-protein kinase, partial [Actinomycetes bacterium]|nr:serine/threonine-protein kinase [Actinomycetes bacterium]